MSIILPLITHSWHSPNRRYGDCIPAVLICRDESFAKQTQFAVATAFSGWDGPNLGDECSDDVVRKLDSEPLLNSIRPKALYVVLRPSTGHKTITTDYK